MGLAYGRFVLGRDILANDLAVLVDRCLDGNQIALREFVDRFRGQVFGLCYRMLGQKEDAEDATQETMIRVVKNLHRWDQTRAIEPWLLTIAGNRCRTKLARRVSRPNNLSLEHPVADTRAISEEVELLSEEIQLALTGLRDNYREAFRLFHEHEMCYAEIAQVLDIPLGTVKTWVHRARRELVAKLKSRGVFGDQGLP